MSKLAGKWVYGCTGAFFFLFAACGLLAPGLSYAEGQPQTQNSQAAVLQGTGTPPQPATVEEGLNQRMALDLRDLDIVDTLKFLAMKGGINIIAGKDVSGRVSLFLKNVTVKDALDIILLANNLAYEKRGDILYVMTEAEYKLAHGANFKDTRKVKIFNLKYAKPDSVFKALDTLKSEIGKIIVDEESGTVVIMDTPEKITQMEQIITDLDEVSSTKTFSLQYARAEDIQSILSSRLDAKKTGSVSIDKRDNQIIITALPERMKEAEEIIKGMDKKTKQVLLEAKILKVILSDKFDMGVDWSKVLSSISKGSVTLAETYPFPSTTTNFLKIVGGAATGGAGNYSVILKALQEFGETRNLSSPSIMVTDGQEAKIHVGTSQAYVTTTIATGSTTSSTAAQVTFLDVGVELKVTPLINDEGFVTMKIKPEVSSVDSTLTYKLAVDVENTVPIVARTTAETNVMVKDGTTIIIGGLRKDEKIKTVDKIPFLGDIPFLGAAFRKTHDALEKDEIVVFITPHIISGDVPAADATVKPKDTRGYE